MDRPDHNETQRAQPCPRGGILQACRRFALVLSLFLCLTTFATTSLAPRPAEANPAVLLILAAAGWMMTDAKVVAELGEIYQQFIQFLKDLKEMLGFVGDLFDLLDEFLNNILDAHTAAAESDVAASEGVAEAVTRAQQSENDVKTLNTVAKGPSEIAAEKAQPPAADQTLCNLITMRQNLQALHRFKEIVQEMLIVGLMNSMRTETGDWMGGTYIDTEHKMVCGQLDGGNGPKTGTTLDGYDASCIPVEDPVGDYKTEGADKMLVGWDVPLKIPQMTETTVSTSKGGSMKASVPVPNEDDASVMRWLISRNYCHQMMGPRPTPPFGDHMKTAEGRAARVQFGHCLSLQSAVMTTCAERIAYLTRPNCDNDEMAPFCFIAVESCSAAIAAGVMPPRSFDNCRYGISLYEAQFLSHALCLGAERAVGVLIAGDKTSTAIQANDFCARSYLMWRKQLADMDARISKALADAGKLSTCWAEYDNKLKIAEAAAASSKSKLAKAAAPLKASPANMIENQSIKRGAGGVHPVAISPDAASALESGL